MSKYSKKDLKLNTLQNVFDVCGFDEDVQSLWDTAYLRKIWDNSSGTVGRWINFEESESDKSHSLLLYPKGNHTLFKQMFYQYYKPKHSFSWAPQGNSNWYIPYKDPVNKLLGGFVSSEYFADKYSKDVKKPYTPDSYRFMQGAFDELVEKTLTGELMRDNNILFDSHLAPLSFIMQQALADRPNFMALRLFPLNLDTRNDLFSAIYINFIEQSPSTIIEQFKSASNQRSPYGSQKHFYIERYKSENYKKIDKLIKGPLKNEYKLLNFFAHHIYFKEKLDNG